MKREALLIAFAIFLGALVVVGTYLLNPSNWAFLSSLLATTPIWKTVLVIAGSVATIYWVIRLTFKEIRKIDGEAEEKRRNELAIMVQGAIKTAIRELQEEDVDKEQDAK